MLSKSAWPGNHSCSWPQSDVREKAPCWTAWGILHFGTINLIGQLSRNQLTQLDAEATIGIQREAREPGPAARQTVERSGRHPEAHGYALWSSALPLEGHRHQALYGKRRAAGCCHSASIRIPSRRRRASSRSSWTSRQGGRFRRFRVAPRKGRAGHAPLSGRMIVLPARFVACAGSWLRPTPRSLASSGFRVLR